MTSNKKLSSIKELLDSVGLKVDSGELRDIVRAIIPIHESLRDFGKSLVPSEVAKSARDRILYYFSKYPSVVIDGKELLVISGIQDYPRRVRELRVQYGWSIISGNAMREMNDEELIKDESHSKMRTDDYILISKEQDREAAFRWKTANDIKKSPGAVKDKIIRYLKRNIGKAVQNDELRYVSNGKTEWARRVRELRTEHGWHIVTRSTGRPDLKVGMYVLESEFQSPEHDRHIPDDVRSNVLVRDGYTCQECSWTHVSWNVADPRHIELHHLMHHARGGENEIENLVALCNKCHHKIHKQER